MRRPQRIIADSLVALAILLSVPSALPQSALAQTNPAAEIATYQGADRGQRLLEGAKKEKELTFYSSIPTEDITALVAAFDKKYGVKVKVWRADSEGFLQRITSEAKARRFEVDVMAGSTSALEPLYRENLLQEVAKFRRPYPRSDCPAPAMDGGLSQHHRPGLQHTSHTEGEPPEVLSRPAQA